MIGLGIVAIAAGFILAWVAVAGWRGRLSYGGGAGVRTRSAMRSDEAFAAVNKAAAPLAVAGGTVMALGGVLAMAVPRHLFGLPLFAGVVTGIALCVAGAAVGAGARK
ncbi:MAG: SdpI family protein [Streptosporangiaceae bacterium]